MKKELLEHIAIVGASGLVGRKILEVMAERNLVPAKLSLLASPKSAGTSISFQGVEHKVLPLDGFDFAGVRLAFFSAGGEIAKTFASLAAAAGAVVIDNSSHFRMDEDVPLCVPEVNREVLRSVPRGIIANPNCSTAQFVVALAPLHRVKKIERVFVATYQSASGGGKPVMNQLLTDVKNGTQGRDSLAFNVIPKIDKWLDGGESKEEWKMRSETAKILDPAILVSSFCARVPVMVGHSEAVFVQFAEPMTPTEAKAILQKAEGVVVSEQDYETPIECEGRDEVFVSRLRQDPNDPKGLHLWITADNLLKGAALNAVQIAECL